MTVCSAGPGATVGGMHALLLPTSETRTRKAIDRMLRDELGTSDGLATA